MTGFGRATAEGGGLKVAVELRSVNHRFADVRLKLPQGLGSHESAVRRLVQGRAARGRIDLTLSIEREHLEPERAINGPLARAALGAADLLRREHGALGELGVADLLRLPGMLDPDCAAESWDDADLEVVHRALGDALAAWDAERVREGETLRADLLARIRAVVAELVEVERRVAELPVALREKLLARLGELGPGIELDPARVAQEATYLADRADVTEETVRLRGHVERLQQLFDAPDGEPVGKRADFLLQEIHRETNTINSKSADLEVSRHALEIKLETEKIREQIQNLE